MGADHLTAHSAADGSLLWSCGGFNPKGMGLWPAISSPLVVGDLAIVPVGRDDRAGQSQIHAVRLDGSGDVTDTHRVWKREDIGIFVTSPVEYAGRIYLLRPRGNLVCLNPETGETIWAEPCRASGSKLLQFASGRWRGAAMPPAKTASCFVAHR